MNDGNQVMSTTDRLIYMADQIARNFAVQGADVAAAATADHIKSYWDPHMKTQIFRILQDTPDRLSPIAAAAIRQLASHTDAG